MNIDNIREYTVIVNSGSGCIFQPEDDTYSYVLTAKHNITDNSKPISNLTRFVLQRENWESVSIDTFANANFYFPHPDKDIAIIKIAKIDGLDKILRLDDFEDDRTGYSLCGYPETRRNTLNQYRMDENVSIQGTSANQLREGQIPNNATIDEIRGHSGGAIVKIKDNHLLLVGIQNKMVDASNEQLGRIEFTPITSFDEIVNQYPEILSPLSPPYCKSFEYLKGQVMKLEGCFHNIEYTRQYLQSLTDEIIGNPLTPQVIKNRLKKRLLIHNEKESSLCNKGLWIAWLELLIILKVIGLNPQTEQELDDIFNQYRIVYSSSKEDWSKLMKDIICSDYKGLKENACFIVANEAEPKIPVLGKGIIPDISRNVTKKQMNIDEGINHPLESFKHIHIYAFQRNCIVEKGNEYINFDGSKERELGQKLKQEYESIINKN
jgi:hypothetical protein